MKDLKNTKALVTAILEQDQAARNSDYILYLRVLQTIAEQHSNLAPLKSLTVVDFLNGLNKPNCPYPGFETVRRSRQKVQAEFPHLCASKDVKEYRAENEEAFRKFAIGG